MKNTDTFNFASALTDDALSFELPAGWRLDRIAPAAAPPLLDPRAGVAAALADPLHSPPLSELAGPGDHVCIAFTPPDSPCPEHILVPALLRQLEAAGVHDQDVTLLCASGLHGRTSHEQKVARLGEGVVERYRVVDHDVGQVIHLGQWQGIPLTAHRLLLEADLVVATGAVRPHLHAGYSGGGETVAVGCAGDATIEALHAPRFLYRPQVGPGRVQGNLFREVVQTLAERAGLRFILNVALGPNGQIADVQAGEPAHVHPHMIFAASSLYDRPVSQVYDVVIAGLDPRYDTSLYQAVLAALFVGLSPRPAVRPGGAIILPARTPDAMGQSSNARNFYHALQSARSPETLVSELWERGYRPGEARAFQLARLLEQNEVIVVGSEFPAIVEACHLQHAAHMTEAIDLAGWLLGAELDALIVPHALNTLPVFSPASDDEIGIPLAGLRAW